MQRVFPPSARFIEAAGEVGRQPDQFDQATLDAWHSQFSKLNETEAASRRELLRRDPRPIGSIAL